MLSCRVFEPFADLGIDHTRPIAGRSLLGLRGGSTLSRPPDRLPTPSSSACVVVRGGRQPGGIVIGRHAPDRAHLLPPVLE